MAELQVRCINKQPRQNPHEGITHLGGDGWKWTRDQVVKSIDAKTNTFFTQVAGTRANVGVVDGPNENTFEPTLTANGTTTFWHCQSACEWRLT